ncbi:aldehyde reductase [Saccharata proteae CBS 121410]|uniref:Aldehyde reductase n=1 Tax=Saccharata proteae CBS 121410 TaxID=1314787 RepID=A0A9P4M061_9PEZI|nr:aldehyde reductase [Saccharata proteae CBS 121410]
MSGSNIQNPTIPKGSLILVTGANGFIGSHVADKFLEAGYKVRGTVRDPKKQSWLTGFFNSKYGDGSFSLVPVADMAAEGAFDEAVKGVSAVAHVASVVTFDPDPNKVIPPVIAGTLNAIKAAAKEPMVKSFVLTSSSTAAVMPVPNKEMTVTADSWNDEAVAAAWAPPPYDPIRGIYTYSASKTQGEQELWKWVKENKPSFVVNTVLPNANFGRVLDPKNQGFPSTGNWPVLVFKGELDMIRHFPPQWYVDVEDSALLHVAAVLRPDVKNERLFAFGEPYSVSSILAAFRKMFPDHKFAEDVPGEGRDISKIVPRERANTILKEMGKKEGFSSLEEGLKKNVEPLL